MDILIRFARLAAGGDGDMEALEWLKSIAQKQWPPEQPYAMEEAVPAWPTAGGASVGWMKMVLKNTYCYLSLFSPVGVCIDTMKYGCGVEMGDILHPTLFSPMRPRPDMST